MLGLRFWWSELGSSGPQTRLPADPMPCAPGLLAPLLGLALGLTLSLPGARAAADCGSLDPAERLAFSSVARARWLAPRVRAPGPLDVLYSSARGFLDIVQRNPFPAGESPLRGALAVPHLPHPRGCNQCH